MKTLAKISLLLLAGLAPFGLRAAIISKAVPYEHDGVALEGYLAYDDNLASGAARPGVLVVPEWWGVTDYVKGRARQLAELGYVAFVADMYGKGVLTDDPAEAGRLAGQFYGRPLMATRAQAGLEQLLAVKGVDKNNVAAIGYCFGGSAVQALAFSGARLAGIVSFHGGLVGPTVEQAKQVNGSVLMLNGAADGFVAASDIAAFKAALEEAETDYVWVDFAGAKHAFTNPAADGIAARTGLGVAYDAVADRRSWRYMQDFFDEIFHRR